MIKERFVHHNLGYSQIWLNLPMDDDCHLSYKEKIP